jgi:hypothetical protein
MKISLTLLFATIYFSPLAYTQEFPAYETLANIFNSSELSSPLTEVQQLLGEQVTSRWIELGRGFKQGDDAETMILQKEEKESIYLEFSQITDPGLDSKTSFISSEKTFKSRLVVFGVTASELEVQIVPGELTDTGTMVDIQTQLTAQQIYNCRISLNSYADTDGNGIFDTKVDKLICYESSDFLNFEGSYHQFVRIIE